MIRRSDFSVISMISRSENSNCSNRRMRSVVLLGESRKRATAIIDGVGPHPERMNIGLRAIPPSRDGTASWMGRPSSLPGNLHGRSRSFARAGRYRDFLMSRMHFGVEGWSAKLSDRSTEVGQTTLTSLGIPSIKVHVIETHFMTASLPNFGLEELQPQSSGCSGRR